MNENLKEEFEYYINNQDELVKKYNGKIIVIKNKSVIGTYDSEKEAIEKTLINNEMGTFIVQKCEPGTESYSQAYHSRVIFA
jgi:hypothetical protein